MKTILTQLEELKELFLEEFLNNTTKVTKVSKGSVLNAIAFATAKVAQKAIKDMAIVESHLFPSNAFGAYLDEVASNLGISDRFGASGSSVYVRVFADQGTVYTKASNTFTGSHGIVFEMEETSVTIPVEGFAYIKVRSVSTGDITNVDPLSISIVNNTPVGHQYVTNEYVASGGRDAESDEELRYRIKNGANLAASPTLAKITQAFMKVNNNVLRVMYYGLNSNGQTRLAVITQNGTDLSESELSDLLESCEGFLSLSDIRPYGSSVYGIELVNPTWYPIDVNVRLKILSNYDVDVVRKEIQVRLNKYMDYRYWKSTDVVEWDDLLSIIKNTSGVEYVSDSTFSPRIDIKIPRQMLPRFRGFIMKNLDGDVIIDTQMELDPVYYPNEPDHSYQSTILTSIAWQS